MGIMQRAKGFTIVELLIVIVVIGILAAVVIVAYNGIQVKAVTARTVQQGSSYNQALLAYKSVNNSYPPLQPNEGGACLGTGYKDRDGDGVGDCGESAYPLTIDPTFNNALKTILASLPIVNDATIPMPYQTSTWVGMSYHYYPPNPSDSNPQNRLGFTVNGASNPNYIMYVVNGSNTNCSLSTLVVPDDSQSGWPKMKSPPSGQNYSWSDGKTTACVGALPN
jgi:prepilin-type N-terminal cleavage/methylation domain-containing protein